MRSWQRKCSHGSVGVWQGVSVQHVHIFIQKCARMFSVLHNRLPGMNQRTQTCWDCVKSCYLFRLDVYYLVADKYKTVYLECSCEREHSPSLKVNTVKMPALHDETSERSRMCYVLRHLSPLVVFFFFFSLYVFCPRRHSHMHTLSRPLTFVSVVLPKRQ